MHYLHNQMTTFPSSKYTVFQILPYTEDFKEKRYLKPNANLNLHFYINNQNRVS